MKQVTINEERLRSIIRETLNGIMETMVNKFTPYSEEDRKRNFSPFLEVITGHQRKETHHMPRQKEMLKKG